MDPNWALARKQQTLMHRARILQAIRAFFIQADFLEVETPQRLPGNAPEFHIDPEPSGSWYLQTSPELCMKRLLAAGCPRLFQLCHCWRQEERGRRHLPEFTLLEWYRGGSDYNALMDDCQQLLRHLLPAGQLNWQGQQIDLSGPWERLSVDQAFQRHAGCGCLEALANDQFDQLLVEKVEPCLGQNRPTLLCDYPLPLGALARRKPEDPRWAERFELYIAGMEIANGFSELCDPVEQVQRFTAEEQQRRQAGKEPYPVPVNFLRELGQLKSAAGIALGIDRLVMLLTDKADIAEVVAFTPEDL